MDGAIARPRKERPQEAKREMLATARDYKRQAKDLERAGTRLQRERDKGIRKAVKGGMPVADAFSLLSLDIVCSFRVAIAPMGLEHRGRAEFPTQIETVRRDCGGAWIRIEPHGP